MHVLRKEHTNQAFIKVNKIFGLRLLYFKFQVVFLLKKMLIFKQLCKTNLSRLQPFPYELLLLLPFILIESISGNVYQLNAYYMVVNSIHLSLKFTSAMKTLHFHVQWMVYYFCRDISSASLYIYSWKRNLLKSNNMNLQLNFNFIQNIFFS